MLSRLVVPLRRIRVEAARFMSVGTNLLATDLQLMPAQSWDEGVATGFARKTMKDLFQGKKVVVFGLPGAFTGVCTQAHVPGYSENSEAFKTKGVSSVLCVSVNVSTEHL